MTNAEPTVQTKVLHGFHFSILKPERSPFKLAVMHHDDETFTIMGNVSGSVINGHSSEVALTQFVDIARINARHLFANDFAANLLPEMNAYVRSLAEGSRSPFFDSPDPNDAKFASNELLQGLKRILSTQTDPYRAAVSLEKWIPFLEPDESIIPLMKAFLSEFHGRYDQSKYMRPAAELMETELLDRSPSIRQLAHNMRNGGDSVGRWRHG